MTQGGSGLTRLTDSGIDYAVADLAAADALLAWMRSQNPPVLHARAGEVELWLRELPIAPVGHLGQPEPDDSPEDAERRELETLLHSSGGDVTPFLSRKGRAA